MNKKATPNAKLLNFMLRAQQIATKADRSEDGYAMVIVSVLSIFLLSLLGAYLTMSNLSKSATNAYIDGNNTFYAAESGLNNRAQQLRELFDDFKTPTGTSPGGGVVTPASMSNCYPLGTTTTVSPTNDFECRNYPFRYNNNIATATNGRGDTVISEGNNNRNTINYIAYTFVADTTRYATGSNPPAPDTQVIPVGETYGGLNALEYRYTVYSTAANPGTDATLQSRNKTLLQMTFKNRIIPLFQFAAFYDRDLEMNSTSNMTISGRVHTNANLYVQPNTTNGAISTTFLNNITAANRIYNRVDASSGFRTGGVVRLQLSTSTYLNFPAFGSTADGGEAPIDLSAATIGALSAADSSTFKNLVKDGTTGATALTTPPAGFLRKRNYYKSDTDPANAVGEYWAKADMRLEMFPDRDVTSALDYTSNDYKTVWTRNEAIIPFNFTSIQTGGAGACITTAPSANTDPANNYIDPKRRNAANLKCNIFTKGQLQSLRQPVLVLTDLNQDSGLQATERTTLGATISTSSLSGKTNYAKVSTNAAKILRAIQVALASTPRPVPLDSLDKPLNDAAYAAGTPAADFKAEFNRSISTIAGVSSGDFDSWSPSEIAAIRNGWFLPAPIQRLTSTADTGTNRAASYPLTPTAPAASVADTAASNYRSSGFYDGREKRWITMLQTNIKSLSVWNRDGLYVEADNQDLTTPYTASNTNKDAAFNSGNGANFTNNLAFMREITMTNFSSTPPIGSLRALGLGSSDRTEGGLVFHATVSDDLRGIGSTNDIVRATLLYQKNPDGSDKLDSGGARIPLDYLKRYPAAVRRDSQSPFGFAFNGGDFLPAPMNLVTDQAIYVQGNFNNNGAAQTTVAGGTIVAPSNDRLPAAIMGDTITALSNSCIAQSSTISTTNHLGVLAGQIRCGLPRAARGAIDLTQSGNTATYYNAVNSTAVNAAFLSYTNLSQGNCRPNLGSYTCGGTTQYSGGLNNYMRMLEDWNGAYFNYSGSFVSLGAPNEYSGTYRSGDNGAGNGADPGTNAYYGIPSRNFNFDSKFTSFNGLPPLTPSVVYLQQEVFKRNY